MNDTSKLRELVVGGILHGIRKKASQTYLSPWLGNRFGLRCCQSGICLLTWEKMYETVFERLEHWEQEHAPARLGFSECAWIVGGGLITWQQFKGRHEKNLPIPVMNSKKKTWSFEEIKSYITTADLTHIHQRQEEVWERYRQAAKENEENLGRWFEEILQLKPSEYDMEEIRKNKSLKCGEKIFESVTKHVCDYVPDIGASGKDYYQFINQQENRLWLAMVNVEKPADLFLRSSLGDYETWSSFKPFDAEEVLDSLIPVPVPDYHEIMDGLERLNAMLKLPSINFVSEISNEKLKYYVSLYEIIYSCSQIYTQVIATPSCSAYDLHLLILESLENEGCSIPYIPEELNEIRRFNWLLIDILEEKQIGLPLIVVGHAENLNDDALQEIKDLNARCRCNFILGATSHFETTEICNNILSIPTPTASITALFFNIEELRDNHFTLAHALKIMEQRYGVETSRSVNSELN